MGLTPGQVGCEAAPWVMAVGPLESRRLPVQLAMRLNGYGASAAHWMAGLGFHMTACMGQEGS